MNRHRILSGIQATGTPHLGNYLGAIRSWVDTASPDTFYMIADLHALTVPKDPAELVESRLLAMAGLLACGLERTDATVFFQSAVPEHTQLAWLLGSITSMGELGRMTQFKAKTEGGQASASLDLYAYPVLQAADILLYEAVEVPVGDDQRQHVELTRDVAERFNRTFGETFVVPKAVIPPVAARVMDLQRPDAKMSKSAANQTGVILLTDTADQIVKKIKRATTDSETEVGYDPANRPGIANLIEIAASVARLPIESAVEKFSGLRYGQFKGEVADMVVEVVEPIGRRIAEIVTDRSDLAAFAARHSATARAVAGPVLARAMERIGLTSLEA